VTSAWSHGWACDVVYFTYSYGPTTRGQYVRSAMSACLLCQSVPNSKNSSAGLQQKWAVRIADLLGVQPRSVATQKYPFHYRSIQSQIAALVSVSD